VLTRSPEPNPGVSTASDLNQVPAAVGPGPRRDIFICGGGEVYRQALPSCSDLYLTLVNRVVEGDVFFPTFEELFDLEAEVLTRPEFKILHYRRRV
jgi:dihydrofolate reductase